ILAGSRSGSASSTTWWSGGSCSATEARCGSSRQRLTRMRCWRPPKPCSRPPGRTSSTPGPPTCRMILYIRAYLRRDPMADEPLYRDPEPVPTDPDRVALIRELYRSRTLAAGGFRRLAEAAGRAVTDTEGAPDAAVIDTTALT